MYTEAAAWGFPGEACLVGLCDINRGRAELAAKFVREGTSKNGGTGIDVFSHTPHEDPYMRAANQRSGAWSILVGVAANRSMAENRPFRIDELCKNIGIPDYPTMPTGDKPLSF